MNEFIGIEEIALKEYSLVKLAKEMSNKSKDITELDKPLSFESNGDANGKNEVFQPGKGIDKVDSRESSKEMFEQMNYSIEPDVDPIENKSQESIEKHNRSNETVEVEEKSKPIENKIEGLRREEEVNRELEEKYPEDQGYTIESEVYLRDEEGNIVKDPVTGEARRVDFVVVKDGQVVDSIEVTSKNADKTEQSAKEARIRENGGNYIKDSDGNLVRIPDDVQTRIERRD